MVRCSLIKKYMIKPIFWLTFFLTVDLVGSGLFTRPTGWGKLMQMVYNRRAGNRGPLLLGG